MAGTKNTIIYNSLDIRGPVTGSSVISSSFIGSLTGTASYSNTSISSSFATRSISSSLATSSSFATNSNTSISSSFATSSSLSVSSSFAISSSFASQATSSSFAISSSLAVSSSFAISSSYAATAPDLYIIKLQVTGLNPSDSLSYYFSATMLGAGTTSTVHKFFVPFNSTLIGAHILAYTNTSSGSAEPSSVYVRVNNSTNILLSNQVIFSGSAVQLFNPLVVTGLSQSLAANDSIQMQWDTPAWTVNPTSCGMFVDLYLVKN